MIVRFIGGIDDHHCVNFRFIMSHFTITVIIIQYFVATHENIYTLYPSINMPQYFDRFLLQMTIFKLNTTSIIIFRHYSTIYRMIFIIKLLCFSFSLECKLHMITLCVKECLALSLCTNILVISSIVSKFPW